MPGNTKSQPGKNDINAYQYLKVISRHSEFVYVLTFDWKWCFSLHKSLILCLIQERPWRIKCNNQSQLWQWVQMLTQRFIVTNDLEIFEREKFAKWRYMCVGGEIWGQKSEARKIKLGKVRDQSWRPNLSCHTVSKSEEIVFLFPIRCTVCWDFFMSSIKSTNWCIAGTKMAH